MVRPTFKGWLVIVGLAGLALVGVVSITQPAPAQSAMLEKLPEPIGTCTDDYRIARAGPNGPESYADCMESARIKNLFR